MAASQRNKLSFTETSGNPIINVANSGVVVAFASTVIVVALTPCSADAYPFTTISFSSYHFKIIIKSTDHELLASQGY